MRLPPVYEHRTHLARTIAVGYYSIRSMVRDLFRICDGRTFVPRLSNSLSSETFIIRPSTLCVSAGSRRTRMSGATGMGTGTGDDDDMGGRRHQGRPVRDSFCHSRHNLYGSLTRYPHRRGHVPLFRRHPRSPPGARHFRRRCLRTVSRWPGASVASNCSHPSRISFPSRPTIDPVTTALGLPIAGLKDAQELGTRRQ